MGATDSKLSAVPRAPSAEGITTVTHRTQELDPFLEKINALEIALPLLKFPQSEAGLKDLLLRHPHDSEYGSLDPTTTASLLTLFQEWQRVASEKINKNQDDLKNKIDVVEALAVKLLQRFNSSLRTTKASATDLEDVHSIKTEVREMKGRLQEVLEQYNTLVKSIQTEGPDFLTSDAKPFVMSGRSSDTV